MVFYGPNVQKLNFAGRKRVMLAVCETINHFNVGASGKVEFFESIDLPLSANSLFEFHKEDEKRIKNAERKISVKARMARRKQRAKRKSKGAATKTSYLSGGFGLSKEPEVNIDGDKDPKKQVSKKQSKKPPKLQKVVKTKKSFNKPGPENNVDSDDDVSLSELAGLRITFVDDKDVKIISSKF